MRTITTLFLLIALFLAITACSMEITPSTPSAAGTLPEEGASAASATTQSGAATGTGAAPAWAPLNLSGELVFIAFDNAQRQHIYNLDLTTGVLTSLFEAPEDTLLTDVAASPDGTQLAFAYAPPVPEGAVQFGFADLYVMPSDGSQAPEPIVERVDDTETFFNLSWPMEDFLYYAHFAPTTGDLGETIYLNRVERFRVSTGEAEILVSEASWPRVSHDGTRLAYVTVTNDLMLADPTGGNAEVLIPGARFPAVDAPLFSLDNSLLYFSAVEPPESSLSWFDRLTGVRVALAHNVPSDWWLQPTAGGGAEQLTNLFEIGLYGDISEDGAHVAFLSTNGIQVMNPDGTGVFRLLEIPATGTLDWIWGQ